MTDTPKILGRHMRRIRPLRLGTVWTWSAGGLDVQITFIGHENPRDAWEVRIWLWKKLVVDVRRATLRIAERFANGKIERLYGSLVTASQGGR